MRFPAMWYVHMRSLTRAFASRAYSTTVKLFAEQNSEFLSLKVGCTGLSESTHVKMTHCWKSHVTDHMCVYMNRTDYLLYCSQAV